MHRGVRYDAWFIAKLVSLEHVRWYHRIEQVHRLAVNAHNLSDHVKHVPTNGIVARGEVCHRQGGQPYLVSPGITCAAMWLVCRLATRDGLVDIGPEGRSTCTKVHAEVIGELLIA